MTKAIALIALTAVAGCRFSEGAKKSSASAPPALALPTGSAQAAFIVDAATVVAKTLDVVVILPGELTPYEQVDIYPRANGFVRMVLVDRGSLVKKGDLLVRLDAPELVSQRLEAEAKLSGDRSTRDRLQAANRQTPGAVAKHDIELAEAAVRASAAKVAALRSLESYLVVDAPFDGIVTERDIHPGALVGPGGASAAKGPPMLKMESVRKLRLTVAVPENETSAVKAGDEVDFEVGAWPQRKFSGAIVRVAHAVDVRTRTMPIEIDVDNADGALYAGMFASVSWHVRRPAPTLFVPEGSVVQGTEKTFVVRIKDGKADPVRVQRGMAMTGLVEVFGQLSAGDTIAQRGSEEMKPGAPVQVRAPK